MRLSVRVFIVFAVLVSMSLSVFAQDATPSVAERLTGLPFLEFLDASYRELLLRDPEKVTVLGLAKDLGVRNDRLTDVTETYIEETQALVEVILELLQTYDRDALSREDRVSYDFYEWYLNDEWSRLEYFVYDYLITSFTVYSEDWMIMDILQTMHPLNSHQDAEDLIARIAAVQPKVGGIIDELWRRHDLGIIAPRFMIEKSIEQLRTWLGIWMSIPEDASTVSPFGTELYMTTRRRIRACEWMTKEEQSDYTDRAVEEIRESYVPAFVALLKTMDALLAVAPFEGGAATMPNGAEFLQAAITHHMTTEISPEEMWSLGLSEVERLQTEMRDIFEELGYPRDADMRVLWQRAYNDAELPPPRSSLETLEHIRAETEALLAPVFDLWPTSALEIRPAPTGTTHNYYMEPALDGSRPGVFYVQSSGDPYAYYGMSVVFHHEAIPGHHVQLAIMKDLDLPLVRQNELPTSCGEGWAVYAEGLPNDLGYYEGNPIGNLERLRMELMRAARVVVEIGVHHHGWGYREGAAYFAEVMGYPVEPMIGLMPRYVGYPGQGASYTIGLLKIRELRQRAMDVLGDAFELSQFHNVILRDGALPLELLEEAVDHWLEEVG